MGKIKDLSIPRLIMAMVGMLVFLFTLVAGSAGWGFIIILLGLIALMEYLFAFSTRRFSGGQPRGAGGLLESASLMLPSDNGQSSASLNSKPSPLLRDKSQEPRANIKSPLSSEGILIYEMMIFFPLLLVNYSSIVDFRIRSVCFLLLIYIFAAAGKKAVRPFTFSLLKAKPVTVWFTAVVIFALASVVLYMQGIHLSGDEPHYLMITQSLVEDGDFDLRNNIQQNTYYEYLPVDLPLHGGRYNGKDLSFHLPGVSFLLIPFYWLFHVLGVGRVIPPALYFRLAASVINAFFAVGLFFLLKRKFPGKEITGFWLLVLCLYPLVFHSIHLYPELPAAALMMFAYLFTFFEKKYYWLAGLLLSLIPWFHVKYIPPLVVLTAAILYRLFKPASVAGEADEADNAARELTGKQTSPDKDKIKNFLQFCLFPVLSLILLVLYSKILYGSFSPTDVFPKESYWDVSWLLRLKVFLAYFLDQRDGLLFYSPFFVLFFFAFKKKLQHNYLLLGVAFSYVFFHAFTTVRGAYSPAGRPLMFASWIFILFIAHLYFNSLKDTGDTCYLFTFRVLVGYSVFVLVWLFYYPLFVYQPVVAATVEGASGFNLFLGSDSMPLWQFFPSFLTRPPAAHPANTVWIVILVIAVLIYYIKPFRISQKPLGTWFKAAVPFAVLIFSAFLYCYYPHVHLISQNKYTDKVIGFYNNSRNFRFVPGDKRFRIKAGNNYDIFIDQGLRRKDRVTFRFINTDVIDVAVWNGKWLLFEAKRREEKEISFPLRLSSLVKIRVGEKWVSPLRIETRARQAESFLWLEIEE